MARSYVPTALMLGNFVIGTSVLAPAGMLNELSSELDVSIREASYLLALGSLVLCIGSPLTSWLTSRMDRRLLLAGSVLLVAVAHFASVFATSFGMLLVLRLAMVFVAAPYTPQAAGVVGLLATEDKRSGAIVYVFLGWSLALAFGLPMVTYLATRFGWQWPFAVIGVMATACFLLLALTLPRGMTVPPVELKTWGEVVRQPLILALLLLTMLLIAGQFVILTFIGPLLMVLANAGGDDISFAIAVYGVAGILGNVIAARIIGRWGAFRTSLFYILGVTAGIGIWTAGAGSFLAMAAGVAIWGFGFASGNSMQQARLISAAPALSGASVALNTSVLYIGQAIGAAVGGVLFERGQFVAMGFAALAFMLLAIGVLMLTRPPRAA